MSQPVHYQPTEARTMCGLLVVPSMTTIGDLGEFFAHYSSGAETHCPRCVRVMRRWALYNEHFRVHNRIRARRIFPDAIGPQVVAVALHGPQPAVMGWPTPFGNTW